MCSCSYSFLLSPLVVQRVETVHEAGYALLQSVQGVMLGVVTRETVPQTAQRFPDELQLLTLWQNRLGSVHFHRVEAKDEGDGKEAFQPPRQRTSP